MKERDRDGHFKTIYQRLTTPKLRQVAQRLAEASLDIGSGATQTNSVGKNTEI